LEDLLPCGSGNPQDQADTRNQKTTQNRLPPGYPTPTDKQENKWNAEQQHGYVGSNEKKVVEVKMREMPESRKL